MSSFTREFGLVLTLALGITLFAAGFKPLMKIASTSVPGPDGLKQALSSS